MCPDTTVQQGSSSESTPATGEGRTVLPSAVAGMDFLEELVG